MVDLQTVCSMCGDVGFPDKLFRCLKCHHRFQHSYCQSEGASSKNGARKLISDNLGMVNRSEYSGHNEIKQNNDKGEESGTTERAKMNPNGSPSPRTATRRYKLLKDVMC
ncbi:hypothetical protein R3W88_026748 [Solanum pinnatisectum]|uniref:PHD-type zinc finger plants domain-containing protein n=1 Tax=Solanum pinnatisectum TaxID=50273 RepID=A0AAV9LE90_9SOLN|nr:hypothetical protein R3W88_026748 [Solanum pinnatisectum]